MNLMKEKLEGTTNQAVSMPTGDYLVMALIIFGGLGVDMLIPKFAKMIVGDGVLYDRLLSNFLTTVVWSAFLYWAFRTLKSKIMQHIYYLFEAGLMTMILILGQRWGEEKWPRLSKAVPVGGIVLCLTWGTIHMLTQDIAVGIPTLRSPNDNEAVQY